MTPSLTRALATAVLGALAGALLVAVFYGLQPSLQVDFTRSLPGERLRGLHAPERDPLSGGTFAWTGPAMTLDLPGLDRAVDWELTLRLRSARPGEGPPPDLVFTGDTELLMARAAPPAFEEVRVTIPARPAKRRGAVLTMGTFPAFVPGPEDPRELGVQVDRIELTPAGIVLPPRRAFAGAAAAAALLGLAVALIGVTATSAVGAALLIAAGTASQVARGFAPHTDYPLAIAAAASGTALALLAVHALARRHARMPLRNTARFALAFSAGALFFKALVVLHPSAGGDLTLAGPVLGVLLETSPLGPTGVRLLVAGVDTAAAALLYPLLAGAWKDRTAAAMALGVYHLVPVGLLALTVAMPDVLARAAALGALWLVLSLDTGARRVAATAGVALLLAVAFASSRDLFPVLACAFLLIAFLRLLGGADRRAASGAILVATLVAALLAAGAHAAVPAAAPHPETSAGALASAVTGARGLGLPLLLLAGFGAARLRGGGERDALTLAAAGWSAAGLAFLAAALAGGGVWGPTLALSPPLAILGGMGAAELWRAHGHWRGAGVVLMAWAVRSGTLAWWRAS